KEKEVDTRNSATVGYEAKLWAMADPEPTHVRLGLLFLKDIFDFLTLDGPFVCRPVRLDMRTGRREAACKEETGEKSVKTRTDGAATAANLSTLAFAGALDKRMEAE
ncbi:MAG TPA: hypothetical protein PKA37_17325, partial [Planctomycetota bacterium]|nr:hypothetical protein [Planctomycetota bacterium]